MPSRGIIHRTAKELGLPSVGMSGSPPTRGFVSTFFPNGIPYEEALNVSVVGSKLTDSKLRKQIADIKKKRAWYSVNKGVPEEWAKDFFEGKVVEILPMNPTILVDAIGTLLAVLFTKGLPAGVLIAVGIIAIISMK
ncbi:TPA: DUF441 family protein [Bacillus cereus]|nr:DUF441 family protein [Bacillus cereus]